MEASVFIFLNQPYFQISYLKQEEKKRWDLKHSQQSLQSGFCVLGAPASFARFLKLCGIWNSRQLRAAYAQWCVHDQDKPIRPDGRTCQQEGSDRVVCGVSFAN